MKNIFHSVVATYIVLSLYFIKERTVQKLRFYHENPSFPIGHHNYFLHSKDRPNMQIDLTIVTNFHVWNHKCHYFFLELISISGPELQFTKWERNVSISFFVFFSLPLLQWIAIQICNSVTLKLKLSKNLTSSHYCPDFQCV